MPKILLATLFLWLLLGCHGGSNKLETDKAADDAYIYYGMALAYAEEASHERAIVYYKKFIELKPDFINAHYNLGLAYAAKKDYDKSIEILQKIIEMKPDYADVYYSLGTIYDRNGDYDKGIEFLQKFIELKPYFVGAPSKEKGTFCSFPGNTGGGCRTDSISSCSNSYYIPDHGDAYENIGLAYWVKKDPDYDKMIETFKKNY